MYLDSFFSEVAKVLGVPPKSDDDNFFEKPFDRMGEFLVKDFIEKEYYFTLQEWGISTQYLCCDLYKSISAGTNSMMFLPTLSSKDPLYGIMLDNARGRVNRATFDYENLLKLQEHKEYKITTECPDFKDKLSGAKKMLFCAEEFPDSFMESYVYTRRLEELIKEEKYEDAAKLKFHFDLEMQDKDPFLDYEFDLIQDRNFSQ